MKLLNRYILQKLLVLFLVTIPAFAFIAMLAQILEKIKNIKKFDTLDFIIYLLASLPEKIYYIIPVAAVIAFIIVYRELIRSRKIYPIFLAGLSVRYLFIPVFIFSILIFALQVIDNIVFMPYGYEIANKYYKKLKGTQSGKQKYLFIANQWIKVNDYTFLYFGFLDLNKYSGKNFIYMKLNPNNFYPVYRIEANAVKIQNNNLKLEDGKIVSLVNIENFNYSQFKSLNFPEKLDVENLKKLVKIKKPVSVIQLYQKASVADKFGYPSSYFWSRFFSYMASFFAPIVLVTFTYPWIWINKKEKYIAIFGFILIYWYAVSATASLAESGALPYFTPLIIDLIYFIVGLIFLFKIKFVELSDKTQEP